MEAGAGTPATSPADFDLDQMAAGAPLQLKEMPRSEKPADLARNCTELVRGGNDFPTIWKSRLSSHPLVIGIPHQRLVGTSTVLDMKLITGERLVFYSDARRFAVE